MAVHGHEIPGAAPGVLMLTGMWLAMMTAMMAPVAAPWVLAFSRFGSTRRAGLVQSAASTLSFSAGYLTAWLAYSIVAAVLQHWLLSAGVLDEHHSWSSIAAASILFSAGLYQFAPIKRACLTHCRNPVTYFLARWRSGPVSGFRLGLTHGWFCVGCCWALMALSMAVGMTNVLWMMALTAAVFVEQVVPHGHYLRIPLGLALIAAAWLHW